MGVKRGSCEQISAGHDHVNSNIYVRSQICENCSAAVGSCIENSNWDPKEGAWNALFRNLSKSGLDKNVVKRSKRSLLEEVS